MSHRILSLLGWAFVFACSLFISPMLFHAASDYHLIRNVLLGGVGGWDYITVDPDAKRVYIPRTEDIQVVDEVSGKIIGDITGMKGLHGVAVAPEFSRGFATGNDPEAEIYLLDLQDLKVTGKLTPPGAKGSDSLYYEPVTKRAFINTAASNNAQVVDAATGRLLGTVSFPGRPEAAVSDGQGNMFVNIVDKDEVVEYDAKTFAIKNAWPSAPCTKGYGIAMDTAHRRLFLACQPGPSAILPGEEGGTAVLTVSPDSTAHLRGVDVGVRYGDKVQIVRGVNPGDEVVISGGLGVDDKAKVNIVGATEEKPDDEDDETK